MFKKHFGEDDIFIIIIQSQEENHDPQSSQEDASEDEDSNGANDKRWYSKIKKLERSRLEFRQKVVSAWFCVGNAKFASETPGFFAKRQEFETRGRRLFVCGYKWKYHRRSRKKIGQRTSVGRHQHSLMGCRDITGSGTALNLANYTCLYNKLIIIF